MNAIVIDDSRAMRTILGGILKSIGFGVREASHGIEGLVRLEEHAVKPELVLVDWNMPIMDGLRFVEEIRSRHDLADVRIVMVSSENDADRMAEALDAGADDYVMKPFTREILVSKLEALGLVPV
ncbi:MAG: PleD family two-component system response regulator [Isosphaeraceae bacterium]